MSVKADSRAVIDGADLGNSYACRLHVSYDALFVTMRWLDWEVHVLQWFIWSFIIIASTGMQTHPLLLQSFVSMSHILEITPFANIVEWSEAYCQSIVTYIQNLFTIKEPVSEILFIKKDHSTIHCDAFNQFCNILNISWSQFSSEMVPPCGNIVFLYLFI